MSEKKRKVNMEYSHNTVKLQLFPYISIYYKFIMCNRHSLQTVWAILKH